MVVKIQAAELTMHKRFVSGHDFESCRKGCPILGFSPCCCFHLLQVRRPRDIYTLSR